MIKLTNRLTLFLGSLLIAIGVQAQVTVDPAFPTADDNVVITFDASAGNGALAGVSPIYAHTGVITSNSTTGNDWKYVQGNWGIADASVLMNSQGGDIHTISFNIRNYYDIPANEEVLSMAFVFRNEDGTVVGRSTDGSDIFYPVYTGGFNVSFTVPSDNLLIYEAGDPIDFTVSASTTCDLTVFHDGNQIASQTAENYTGQVGALPAGNHTLIVNAFDGNETVSDTIYYAVNPNVTPQDVPGSTKYGITDIDNSTMRLYLHAPLHDYVYVIGNFTDWRADVNYFMTPTVDGSGYWLDVPNLVPGQEIQFQYLVDGSITIADPYAEVVLDQGNDGWIEEENYPNLPVYPFGQASGFVTQHIFQEPDFQWLFPNFVKPPADNLVIYELLVRDFSEEQSFKEVLDRLDYLEQLGITAVQFMPPQEYEGNNSWGYNPSYHGALDKYYGSQEMFKTLIDQCHARGIAVIVDVVFNHGFSQNPLCQLWWNDSLQRPAPNNPYFNVTDRHPLSVGFDFNHESVETQRYMDDILKFWVEEYHIDGFRFDLSKGFTQNNTLGDIGLWSQYDQSRINLLNRMKNEVLSYAPDHYMILEHLGSNDEEIVLADNGFMLWGNSNDQYSEAAMGYSSNMSNGVYNARSWSQPRLVTYMESHDEERLMYKTLVYGNSGGGYDCRDLSTALDRVEMVANAFIPLPGPKMIWQFGELGYEYSINRCLDGTVQEGCRLVEKPVRWDYLQDQRRVDVYETFRNLNYLKKTYSVFRTTNFNYSLWQPVKTVNLYGDFDVAAISNTDVSDRLWRPNFSRLGTWYEYFSGDSVEVTDYNQDVSLGPGEYRLYTSQKIERLGPADLNTTTGLRTDDYKASSWSVFPNPSSGAFLIQANTAIPVEVLRTDVFNSSGQRIAVEVHSISNGVSLDLSDYPDGIYYLRCYTANGGSTTVLQKQ
ncbi:MAG: alpha-amylase family glycosyl hydrolase [Chitinophagales bacterium]